MSVKFFEELGLDILSWLQYWLSNVKNKSIFKIWVGSSLIGDIFGPPGTNELLHPLHVFGLLIP
jgi:hypothetical protein